MHHGLGRLRGKTPPADHILDRLVGICPTFKAHWQPWAEDGKHYWFIANHVGTPIYRATGQHCFQRLEQHARATGKPADPGLIAGAELMMDGGYIVRWFTDAQFGTEWMFQELQAIGPRLQAIEAGMDQAHKLRRLKLEWQMCRDERNKNAAFRAYLDELVLQRPDWIADQEAILKEAWPFYMRGRRSVTQGEIVCASPDSATPTPANSSAPTGMSVA